MSASLKFDGMAEFRAALRQLPEHLTGEARHIVEGTANAAHADVRRAYPSHTGHLIGGVVVTRVDAGKVSAGAILKSTAKHAHIFEYGTRGRRTSRGWNRGQMPKAPQNEAMVPIVVRHRRTMMGKLIDMLRRNGLVVEGQP